MLYCDYVIKWIARYSVSNSLIYIRAENVTSPDKVTELKTKLAEAQSNFSNSSRSLSVDITNFH